MNEGKPIKRRYLVDYENVHTFGLNGIDMLSENDEVIIFYSKNSNAVTFETVQTMLNTNANILFTNVVVGTHDALDFQLATFLGYIVAINTRDPWQIIIISKDHGYDVITAFWKEHKNIIINRAESIADAAASMFANPYEFSEPVSEHKTHNSNEIYDKPKKHCNNLREYVANNICKKYRKDKYIDAVTYALQYYNGQSESAFFKYIKGKSIKTPNDIKSVFNKFFVGGLVQLPNKYLDN